MKCVLCRVLLWRLEDVFAEEWMSEAAGEVPGAALGREL